MRQPADLRCDTTGPIRKRVAEGVSDPVTSADAIEETRLENAGDTERWGCEENTQGRRRAHNEVLNYVSLLASSHGNGNHLRVCMGQTACRLPC